MATENTADTFVIPLETYHAAALSEEDKKKGHINKEEVKTTLEKTTDQLNNVKGVMELLPDLKLAMQIRTSMILSPKDMLFDKLRLKLKGNDFELDNKVLGLINLIEDHFRFKTPLEKDISKFIDEALFMYGAHIWLMVPPSTFDAYIQGRDVSLEGMDDMLGKNTLTAQDNTTMALLGIKEITNNPNAFKEVLVRQREQKERQEQIAMESFGLTVSSYQRTARPVGVLQPTVDLRPDANPIIFDVPVDSCLMVSDPSAPQRHLFAIIQVDKNGTITTNSDSVNQFELLGKRLKTAVQAKSGEEYKLLKAMGLKDDDIKKESAGVLDLYSALVETQIEKAIDGTAANGGFTFSNKETFYRTLFMRTMRKEQTRLICVPAEMVDYMAFDYGDDGHGVGLLEKTQLYSSLRAVLMFSDLIRQVVNSVPQTNLNITLDEDELDPQAIIQKMLADYGRITDRSIPLGVFSAPTMIDEIRRAGIRVNVDGGERFPNTKMEVEDTQRQIPRVESDLSEQLQKSQYAGLGVQPELINQALQGDFAINTVTNNQLFVKRSMVDQATFIGCMEQRMSKYIYLSNELYTAIVATVGEDKAPAFIDALTLSLPSADYVRLEQQMEAYQAYSDLVDLAVEHHISDAMLRGLVESSPVADTLDELREVIASHFKRQYLVRENILPELQDLYTDESGKRLSDQLTEYHATLLTTVGDFIKGLMKTDNKVGKSLNKAREKLDAAEDESDVLDRTAPTVPFGGREGTPSEPDGQEEDVPEPEDDFDWS